MQDFSFAVSVEEMIIRGVKECSLCWSFDRSILLRDGYGTGLITC
jgi:hypothetical protein